MNPRRCTRLAVTGCALVALVIPAAGDPGQIDTWRAAATTPDGAWTVFLASPRAGEMGLYRLPVAGGRPVRLDVPALTGSVVEGFEITSDGTRVVYKARQDRELFSVPIDGSEPPVRLNDLALGGDVLALLQRGHQIQLHVVTVAR